jgi:hypothetical protein
MALTASRFEDSRLGNPRLDSHGRSRCRASHRAAVGVSPLRLPFLTPPALWACALRLSVRAFVVRWMGGLAVPLYRATAFSPPRAARALRAGVLAAG